MLGSGGGCVRSSHVKRIPPSPSGSLCTSPSGSSPRPVSTRCWSRASLFGRWSAVDVTGLLAIIDPFFIFHCFFLVFLHPWFQSHSLSGCVFKPLFPLMSLSDCLFVHDLVVLCGVLVFWGGACYQIIASHAFAEKHFTNLTWWLDSQRV